MDIKIDDIITSRLSSALTDKYERLQNLLRSMQCVVVAYSGGVDSTLLAKVALDTLRAENIIAVMAVSPSLSPGERRAALTLLDEMGIPSRTIQSDEVDDPRYAANNADRCYFCKVHVTEALLIVAEEMDFDVVVDGFNRDDVGDHRPGHKAGRERGVRSLLYEAELDKNDVRTLARHLGLPNWNKPAMACLSSRVAYGTTITSAILEQVDKAETALHQMGFTMLRVRHHDGLARIEVPPENFADVMAQRDQIVQALHDVGYTYVTLDLQGFRSGSINEVLRRSGS